MKNLLELQEMEVTRSFSASAYANAFGSCATFSCAGPQTRSQ